MSAEIKAEWLAKQAEAVQKAVDDGLGLSDLATIIKIGMEAIELVKGMDGEEKQEAVIELACMFIDKTDTPWLPDSITDPIMKKLLRSWGPGLINLVVGASKGEVKINQ